MSRHRRRVRSADRRRPDDAKRRSTVKRHPNRTNRRSMMMQPPIICDLDRLQHGVADAWKSFDVATVNGNAVTWTMEND